MRERGNNCGIIRNLFEAFNGNSSILNHCPLLHQSQSYMAELVQSNCNGRHFVGSISSVSGAVCGHSTRVYVQCYHYRFFPIIFHHAIL